MKRVRTNHTMALLLMGGLMVCFARAAAAQPLLPRSSKETFPLGLDAAIDRGLSYLQKQQRADGSFDATGNPAATSGLAILAFLSAGHAPDLGKYGLTVRNAIDHLVALNPADGYYKGEKVMQSHCVATLALAQVCGLESDDLQRRKVRAVLERSLKVILAAQNARKDKPIHVGGW